MILLTILAALVLATPPEGVRVTSSGLVFRAPVDSWARIQVWGDYTVTGFHEEEEVFSGSVLPHWIYLSTDGEVTVHGAASIGWLIDPPCQNWHWIVYGGTGDFNIDGAVGTDEDIEAFFRCLGSPCNSDFNGDGDMGTDEDIECFFMAIAGQAC